MPDKKETDQVLVKAKRPFEGDEGFKDENSAPFSVSRRRFAELKANGLVEETKAEAKQAPAPANKMAQTPVNKVRPEAGKGEKA